MYAASVYALHQDRPLMDTGYPNATRAFTMAVFTRVRAEA